MKILLDTYRATGNELITKMPITGTAYKFYVLRTICIEDIKAGDKFNFFGGFSVTDDAKLANGNWTQYPIMAGCYLSVSDVPLVQGSPIASGILIDRPSGQNINKTIHHYRTRLQGQWEADCDYERKYFNVMGYAASSLSTQTANEVLTVDQNYGSAWVDQYRDYCPEGTQNGS